MENRIGKANCVTNSQTISTFRLDIVIHFNHAVFSLSFAISFNCQLIEALAHFLQSNFFRRFFCFQANMRVSEYVKIQMFYLSFKGTTYIYIYVLRIYIRPVHSRTTYAFNNLNRRGFRRGFREEYF